MKTTTRRRLLNVKKQVRAAISNTEGSTQAEVMEALSKQLGYSVSHLYLIMRTKIDLSVESDNTNQLSLFKDD